MELELLDKKIRRLVCKLKKHNVDLEVFEHDDIEYGEVLGKGGEGLVQQCTVWYNGLPVEAAVKTLLDNSDDAICITLDEIELLCLAKDPIINTTIGVYGVAAVPDKQDSLYGQLVIITEAGLMNALQLYQQEDIPQHVTFDLWSRIAAAVHMMHLRKIIHQDLKPENILVTGIVRDRTGQIEKVDFKIIDLGMGKRLFTEKMVTDDILGTNGYHPPEVLFEESYDFTADIFMLGVTFCVTLLSRGILKKGLSGLLKKLHSAKKTKKLVGRQLFESVFSSPVEDNSSIPNEIKTMLCKMLERQSKRIKLVKVVETCRRVAFDAKEELTSLPPVLAPCDNCQVSGDSGISCRSCSTDQDHLSDSVFGTRSRRPVRKVRRTRTYRVSTRSSSSSTSLDSSCDKKRKVSSSVCDPTYVPYKRKRTHVSYQE